MARIAGTTRWAIRHYHHVGLLPEPERKGNGYRVYAMRDTHADEPTLTADLAAVLRELAAIVPAHPGLERDRDALQLLTSLAPDRAADVIELYANECTSSSPADELVLDPIRADLRPVQRRLFELVAREVGGT